MESRDFQELNKAIEKTLNVAMDQVGRTVNQMGKNGSGFPAERCKWVGSDPGSGERSRMEREQRYKSYSSGGSADRHMYEQARQAGSRSWREQGNAWDNRSRGDSKSRKYRSTTAAGTAKPGGLTAAGVLLTVSGGVLTGTMGIGFLVTAGVLTLTHQSSAWELVWVLGVRAVYSRKRCDAGEKASAFKNGPGGSNIIEKLGKRDYCSIEELQKFQESLKSLSART